MLKIICVNLPRGRIMLPNVLVVDLCTYSRKIDSTINTEQNSVLTQFHHCATPVKHQVKTVLKEVHCALRLPDMQ